MQYSDYYAYGMTMPNRNGSVSEKYRYAFNGMETDQEVSGSGNSYDFGARQYDPRLGRWMSRDPLETNYISVSTYAYVAGNPIYFIDPDGMRIMINGTKEEVAEIAQALNVIYGTSVGKEIIDKLIESDISFRIETIGMWYTSNYTEQNNNTLEINMTYGDTYDSDPWEGDGSTAITLMHELTHAFDDIIEQERWDEEDNFNGYTKSYKEKNAMLNANLLRSALGKKNMRYIYDQDIEIREVSQGEKKMNKIGEKYHNIKQDNFDFQESDDYWYEFDVQIDLDADPDDVDLNSTYITKGLGWTIEEQQASKKDVKITSFITPNVPDPDSKVESKPKGSVKGAGIGAKKKKPKYIPKY